MQEKNLKKINIDIDNKLIKLSKNLRNMRLKLNKSQQEMSMAIGIERRQYQRIESQNPPDIKFSTLNKILIYYNLSLEDLLK